MGPKGHSKRNFLLCLLGTYILFLIGSATVLAILLTALPSDFLPRNVDRGTLVLEMSATLTIVISLIAIPLGFGLMYLFGGFLSTRAMKLYLLITRGKHIVLPKIPDAAPNNPSGGTRLKLRRQVVYWLSILAVVVSFATYLARHRIPIVAPQGRSSDISALITGDFVTLTMSASLIVPVVALALPYFGGLRLRSIDVGPFHTTLLSTIIGISGGFTLLYAFFTKPSFQYVIFYVFLFMGVCWCFALGCNLAADPVNRHIARQVFSAKPNSRVVASKIWLGNPPGRLVEV